MRATNAVGDSANTSTASALTAATSSISIPDGSFEQVATGTYTPETGQTTITTPETASIPGSESRPLPRQPTTGVPTTDGRRSPGATDPSNGDYMASEDGNQHLSFFGGELFAGYPWQDGWPAYGIIPAEAVSLESASSLGTTVAGATYSATIGVANPLWNTDGHMTSGTVGCLRPYDCDPDV